MEIRPVADGYSVSAQIQPTDIADIKKAGFKTIICNRPDNEDPGQPSADAIKREAEAAGLAFRWVPVISGQMTPANVEEMAAVMSAVEGPVFAYCRSGTRSTTLYVQGQKAKG